MDQANVLADAARAQSRHTTIGQLGADQLSFLASSGQVGLTGPVKRLTRVDFADKNYTRWAEKVKFMIHVLKLAFVLDPELAPIPANPIPETGKTMDPTIITELEKQRTLCRESEELCVGHIKNSLSDRLYDLYTSVKDPRELWNALELKYKAHEEGTDKYLVSKYLEFQMADDKSIIEQVGAIIAKLPPSWKDFSKRMMHKFEDYSLDDLMKHLRIEEETRIRNKRGKVGVTSQSYSLKISF
uniref:Uncharacterized protein n=1 Tax=Lactuca sativa TaxID=4236 RepID=A0A9R1VV52_LACSA|nr:hypothetical protein LSAT_V11C400178980 [Lactuca sativa]